MAEQTAFYQRAEQLFGKRLGYGRRWKSAAADLLGIGRASLYRYLEDDSGLPDHVRQKLEELDLPAAPVRGERDMIVLMATAIVELQDRIDTTGWLASPYPAPLRRLFDLGAARNLQEGEGRWPTDLAGLARVAGEPLFRWVRDLAWDEAGDFVGARLMEDGEASTACRVLAIPGGDPEREIEENAGYALLMRLCLDRPDGEDVYRTWRTLVIRNVVLASWSSTVLMDPLLASLERTDEIVEAFYDRIPEGLAIDGLLPLCTVSGTVLRRDGRAFHTEYRDPEAQRRARDGVSHNVKYRPGMLYLKRAFRTFWTLPGLAEVELADRLSALGWTTTLWPALDRVDLIAVSPDGRRRLAIDVKDYLSPASLAARFAGFKGYAADHECLLVIPDYVAERDPGFERRFAALRASQGRTPVRLSTVSDLAAEAAR